MPVAAETFDLFAWCEMEDAQERCDRAEAERERAARRYHHAPRGQRIERLIAFQEATNEALRADADLWRAVRASFN